MGRPNVLLITVDCLRYDAVAPSTAPTVLRLGREGAYLRWAFSTSSWTLPSLNGFMTGTHPLVGGGDVTLSGRVTVAEVLSRAGYFTVGVTKHPYLSRRYGFGRGFRVYDDRLGGEGGSGGGRRTPLHTAIKKVLVRSRRLFPLYVRRYVRALRRRILTGYRFYAPAPEINEALLKELAGGGRPFFAWVHYLDTHFPYLPEGWDREELAELNVRRQLWWWGVEEVDEDALRRLREAYLAKVREVDEAIAALLDSLAGEAGGLAVVVTADHGEEFNEHGMFHHGCNNVWATLTHVPLAAGGPAADRLRPLRDTFIDHTLVAAELVRLATGSEPPGSWRPTRAGRAFSEDAEPAVRGEIPTVLDVGRRSVAVGEGGWRYLRRALPDGRVAEGLYNLVEDPLELRDLAGSGVGEEVLERLRRACDAFLRASGPRKEKGG